MNPDPFGNHFRHGIIYTRHMERDVMESARGLVVRGRLIAPRQFKGRAADVNKDNIGIRPSMDNREA
jgi:hypothetical protein